MRQVSRSRSAGPAPFHPVIAAWFSARYGQPTPVQAEAWPRIAAGEHLLACAPTGSGKTLAAFLWALDRLLTGAWDGATLQVLYVSPLKALGTDVRRNLLAPLAELRTAFAAAGLAAPDPAVLTRTGDTPANERRRMLRRPPAILITTPESLNLLLTAESGRAMLRGVRTVILDEIHAVAGSKRGVHLMAAVEHLTHLAGEVQRLALSATVRPLDRVAELVGGWRVTDGEERRRPVAVVQPPGAKTYALRVAPLPQAAPTVDGGAPAWPAIAALARERMAHNRATLVFANSRRLTERLTRLVNEGADEPLAYAHHGSLSRELRAEVESRLKEGRLRGLVATSSLELGIDIGQLDEVLLVQTPPSVAAAVQRLGRAGHGVGEVSRGAFLPTHPRDLLDAAVMLRAVREGDLEPLQPVRGPLDVLAQVILSMTAHATWSIDQLWATLRGCAAYHDLGRRELELVLAMLAGRYAETRVRALEPRVYLDRIAGTVRAREHVPHLLYSSGGTIPERGLFTLRLVDSRARLGELDEEFVWERKLGDVFSLGAQSWRVEQITASDVLVAPAGRAGAPAPFWRAEAQDRSSHFAGRVAELLERLDAALDGEGDEAEDGPLLVELERDHGLDTAAGAALLAFLRAQRLATGAPLPHRHHLLVERCQPAGGDDERQQVILHTLWGGRLNHPFALALAAALEERFGYSVAVAHDDDSVVLAIPHPLAADELLRLVPAAALERLVRRRLERSGTFGARFRDAAGRALLLPRQGRRRLPLWLNRLRAKKLLAAVSRYNDFPITLEALRTCLRDDFELEALAARLDELARGELRVSAVQTLAPSPFARQVTWRLNNREMYADDTPLDAATSRVSTSLLRELGATAGVRRVTRAASEALAAKRQRVAPGYAPASADELVACVQERVLVDEAAWHALVDAVAREQPDAAALCAAAAERLAWVTLPNAPPAVAALETIPRLQRALSGCELSLAPLAGDRLPAPPGLLEDEEEDAPLSALVGQWLQQFGPLALTELDRRWGLTPTERDALLEPLREAEAVIVGPLTEDADALEVCDADNLELLWRQARARARPSLAALPLTALPLFLAAQQGLVGPRGGEDQLHVRLAQLAGFVAPAGLWETELLPARVPDYRPAWLDALFAGGEVQWWGCGREAVLFAAPGERELLGEPRATEPAAELALLPEIGRVTLGELLQQTGRPSAELSAALWRLAWAGEVSNDGWAVIRRGLESGFAAEAVPEAPTPGRRDFRRWRATRPFVGAWYRLPAVAPLDPLEREERDRERARLVAERYGVLFRELLSREPPALQWAALFPALRALEWAGELVAGHFFASVPGLQFATPAAVAQLEAGLPDDALFWLSALDPASPCGLGLPADFGLPLPRRVGGSHVVFRGAELLLVAERHGRELCFRPGRPPAGAAELFTAWLGRAERPLTSVDLERIDNEPATRHAGALTLPPTLELVRGPRRVHVQRRG